MTQENGPQRTGLPKVDFGTVTGVLFFVGTGLTTVLAAITDFGADEGALAAARRNHTGILVAAAGFAAAGMFCGALFGILRNADAPTQKRPLRRLLGIGALFVLLGVVLGVIATTLRTPGRPTITVQAAGPLFAVKVTGEGLASHEEFEMLVRGFSGPEERLMYIGQLGRARFSPTQAGTLDWSMQLPRRPRLTGVTIIVDSGDRARECETLARDPNVSVTPVDPQETAQEDVGDAPVDQDVPEADDAPENQDGDEGWLQRIGGWLRHRPDRVPTCLFQMLPPVEEAMEDQSP